MILSRENICKTMFPLVFVLFIVCVIRAVNSPPLVRMYNSVVYVETEYWNGSGVIVDAEKGYILTAFHVIDGIDWAKINLADGRTMESCDFDGDFDIDVAIIVIDANNLTASPIGNSDKVDIGDTVYAVGCPFGLFNSITKGILSGRMRNIWELSTKQMLQSDASINPGSSGGGLFNKKGELIGLTVGGMRGIGFTIPSNICKLVLKRFEIDRELEEIR